MKNISSLTILLVVFSLWAVAKTPFPAQTTATTQVNLSSSSTSEQTDNLKGPNPTGVETIDQTGNEVMSVYPNPATAYVDVKLATAESKVDITLFDVTGKLLKSVNEAAVGDKAIRIPRDNLPSGVYFLLVKTTAGQQCRKVIFS